MSAVMMTDEPQPELNLKRRSSGQKGASRNLYGGRRSSPAIRSHPVTASGGFVVAQRARAPGDEMPEKSADHGGDQWQPREAVSVRGRKCPSGDPLFAPRLIQSKRRGFSLVLSDGKPQQACAMWYEAVRHGISTAASPLIKSGFATAQQ